MRRLAATFAAFTLVVAVPGFAADAFAHGGRYQGPPGEVPPDSREPSDPPPPPESGGPQTPGGEPPGGPTTGGPDAGGPETPSGSGPGAPATGPGGGGAPPTGGTGGGGPTTNRAPGAKKSAGFSSWAFWWGNNKDEILQLKRAVLRMGPASSPGFGRPAAGQVRAVTDQAIQDEIVPALRKFLVDPAESFHIRSAAELGLAKIGDASITQTLREMALNDDRSLHHEIVETAALALGLLQRDDAETREFLVEIVKDGARDGTYVRPFAAISLGLLGDRADKEHAVVKALVGVVARKEPGADVKSASLAALGLLGNEAAIPELVAMARNGRASAPGATQLSEIETAYAVAALGKIGKTGVAGTADETAALDEVLRILTKDRSRDGANTRRSAAIALGQIGANASAALQRKAIDVLKDVVDGNGDEQERNFAVMSLARIGAAKATEHAVRKGIVSTLGRVMAKSRGQTPAFAAMALGLVGRSIVDAGGVAPEDEIRAPLRERFAEGGDAQLRGAFALASGLVRDPLAVEPLLATLKDPGADKRIRGWSALALGLVGSRDAVEPVRAILKTESDRDLRVQCAMAAGLLADAAVIGDVVAVLRDPESSNYELGSAALALGQIGDERAVKALVEIAVDAEDKFPDLTRSLAVVALGQIGDRRDVPTLARLATDVNYRAHVAAITELLTIL